MDAGTMKKHGMKLLLLAGIVLFHVSAISQNNPCKISFDATVNLINGHTNGATVKPGDTICLTAGTRNFLLISYIHGTHEAPVTIINQGGQVTILNSPNYAIKFDSCSHIRFTGSGDPLIPYGFKTVNAPGTGVSIDGMTTDIELDRLEVSYTAYAGIIAKTEPDCAFKSTRDKFTLRNLSIHNCYVHHTGNEGFYIGSSKFKNGQTLTCNGRDTVVFPHLLKGVQIFNNLVEFSGWDGIQVSSADSGCFIHDNTVLYDSEGEVLYQMSGIILGGGTQAECFNNTIRDGKGDGIDVVSQGTQNIYNNLICNPGRTYKPDQNVTPYLKHGIYIGTDYTAPTNTYLLLNNTILSPKSYCVQFADGQSTGNVIANNILVNPGSYSMIGDIAYLHFTSSMDVRITNNIKTLNINDLDFKDPAKGDFDLKKSSPAVNTGTVIEGFPVNFDLLNRIRPFAHFYDIGAYECQDSALLTIEERKLPGVIINSITPNPIRDHFFLDYHLVKETTLEIALFDIRGKKLLEIFHDKQRPGDYHLKVDCDSLQPGCYLLSFKTGNSGLIKKIIQTQ